jgi:uncharacterized protein YndB with AHSA1/START domain
MFQFAVGMPKQAICRKWRQVTLRALLRPGGREKSSSVSISGAAVRCGSDRNLNKRKAHLSMNRTILAAILVLASYALLLSAPETNSGPENLMAGKQKTDRTIYLEAMVNSPPAVVFQLWTSEDGIKKFFAPSARVDASAGGRFEIIFAPAKDPEGNSHGTKGARILKLVPEKELAFEWITFAGDELLGRNAPPYAPSAERNVRPLPTWVELQFDAVEGEPGKTHLRFAHYGFRHGEKWEQSFHWFERAWKGVLDELAAYCQNSKSGDAKR